MPFQLIHGDITRQRADAIVNAANSSLLGGGGVDGAIHMAAGPGLLEECRTLGGCLCGEAKITGGYNLPSRYVIHTVGPIWRGGVYGEEGLLRACYRNSLRIAAKYQLQSVAFPLISAGAYGYPREEAIHIAMEEIRSFLDQNEEMVISLVLFDRASFYESDPELAQYLERRENRRKAFYSQMPDKEAPDFCAQAEWAAKEMSAAPTAPMAYASMAPMQEEEAGEKKERKSKSLFSLRSKIERTKSEGKAYPESLEAFLKKQDKGFNQYLLDVIDEKHMTDPECYKRANVTRKTFSKIRNGEMKPGKEMVLAFCVALRLSVPEAEMLLGKAGYALTNSSRGDLIVQYFLEKKVYDIDTINFELLRYDQKLLGSNMNG